MECKAGNRMVVVNVVSAHDEILDFFKRVASWFTDLYRDVTTYK